MTELLQYFKEEAYEAFLMEDLARTYGDIIENQNAIFEAMDAYEDLIKLEESFDSLNEEEIDLGVLQNQMGQLKDIFGSISAISDGPRVSDVTYAPIATEIKAPSKLESFAGFITAIVTWIKNVFIALITKIGNVLRRLTGAPTKEMPDISLSSLIKKQKAAMTLEKIEDANDAAKYSHITAVASGGAKIPYDVNDSSADKIEFLMKNGLDEEADMTPEEAVAVLTEDSLYRAFDKMPRVVDGDVVEDKRARDGIKMGGKIETEHGENKIAVGKPQNNIVLVDPSQDVFNLREALGQFFLLFDNSIGSNGEKLFETDDLQMLLKAFEATKKALDTGDVDYMAVGNKVSQFNLISADKLKDNLIRTKVNTDKLTHAYQQVDTMMQTVLQAIAGKDYNMAVAAPGVYKVLSTATYKQMIEIVKILNKRVAQAKKLEKKLDKVRVQYEKLANELSKMKAQWLSIGMTVSYSTVTQQRVSELFDAAKYVLQTIMLRYGALGIYTKVLKNTKDTIANLNFINSRASLNPIVRLRYKI